MTSLNVLVTGASGFIGSAIVRALQKAGHQVHAAGRASGMAVDFVRDTSAAAWLPRLQGIDAVVNAVGVLRDSRSQPMAAIHAQTPIALFDACALAGVQRVVHISALGVADGDTPYAVTKKAADAHLLSLTAQGKLAGLVLRPSVVFGPGGASTALLMNLAQLPMLLMPHPVKRARVQPVAVPDLALALSQLLAIPSKVGMLEIAGPQALTMAELIASLRAQMGKKPAWVLPLPDVLTQLSARAGDMVPFSPWCSQSLALMEKENVADYRTLRDILGREAIAVEAFLRVL